MKQIKKIVSIMLTLAMTLAMSVTVFATEPEITVPSNTEKGQGDFTITLGLPGSGQGVTDYKDYDKYSYNAYQIFAGDLTTEKVLSNIVWGVGVDTTKVEEALAKTSFAGKTPVEIAKLLDGKGFDDELAKEFAASISNCLAKTATGTSSVKYDSDDTSKVVGYEINNLAAGYYLVASDKIPNNGATTRYMMEVVGNVTATPKSDVPTTDKKIVEGTDKVTTNEASIGDEVNYEITGTMPSNIADYKTYYYMFTDTLSKGLTYKEDSIKVTVNGVDVTKYFYKGVGEYNEATGTTIEVGILDLKALSLLTDLNVGEITKSTKVVLTYTATLNENAVIAGEGNPNDVKLSYSNDPNNSGDGSTTPPENPDKPKPTHPTGETPKDEVVTYTTELAILKTNEEGAILQGAEFTITGNGVKVSLVTTETFESDENGAYWKLANGSYTTIAPVTADDESNNEADYDLEAGKFTLVRTITTAQDPTKAVATIDADGRVTFTGLGAGTYTIEETKTPAGYNTIEPITFTVTFDETSKTFSADKVSLGVNNTLETTIVNKKGSLLPSTGGIGTTIFYIIGGILVVGAAILLITKKRMSSEAQSDPINRKDHTS